MRYTKKVKYEELREKYDYIIGWGTPRNEFKSRYNPFMYKLDFVINGQNRDVGKIICGIKVYGIDKLKEKMIQVPIIYWILLLIIVLLLIDRKLKKKGKKKHENP